MSIENARQIGQGRTGGVLEVRYISSQHIAYTCHKCHKQHKQLLDVIDIEKEWYKFQCRTCDNTRMVNLRKVVMSGNEEQ
jgi:DNA-directed RNA polymerase subunit RPC12/RpoP